VIFTELFPSDQVEEIEAYLRANDLFVDHEKVNYYLFMLNLMHLGLYSKFRPLRFTAIFVV
jgi:hypothetical protein